MLLPCPGYFHTMSSRSIPDPISDPQASDTPASVPASRPYDPLNSRIGLVMNDRAIEAPLLQQGLSELEATGYQITRFPILSAGEGRTHAKVAIETGIDILIACGGDGTVNEVINGMMELGESPECSLGIIPFGTGNDFATSTGVPIGDPVAALETIIETPPRWVDLGRIEDLYYINTATAGFCAEVTTNTPDDIKRLLGGLSYLVSGLQQMRTLCAHQIRLESEEMVWEGPAFALFVSNGRTTGGGFQVAPRAWLDDGLLDFMLIPELSLPEFLPAWDDYLRLGEEATSFQQLIRFQSRNVMIESSETLQLNLDGQPLRNTRFRCSCHPHAIRVHAPAVAPIRQPIERPGNSG